MRGKGMKKVSVNRNRCSVAAVILLSMLLAAGCGSSGESYKKEEIAVETPAAAPEERMPEYEMSAEEMGDAGDGVGTGSNTSDASGENAADAQQANRKLIREVNLSVETKDFDALMKDVTARIGALGGYIESSDLYSDSIYADPTSSGRRTGSLKARIPADKLDEFLNQVAEVSNVTWKAENVKDVTLQYVDLESHKKALQTEQTRLLELLELAESVEDVITIEGRLSEVRYQIESMESKLRTFDNQIDYSTVYMDIMEVARMTPVETDTSAWERMKVGFSENIYRVTNGLQNFGIEFVIALPVIFVWVLGISIVLLIVMMIRKKCKNRRAKKITAAQMRQPMSGGEMPPPMRQPMSGGEMPPTIQQPMSGGAQPPQNKAVQLSTEEKEKKNGN